MILIGLLLVALLWAVVDYFFVKWITKKMPEIWWTYLLRPVLFFAILPLPLIDEIVGKYQFERLCSENASIVVDRASAKGKTVYLAPSVYEEVPGTWVRVVVKQRRYLDVKSNEVVVSFNELSASRRGLRLDQGGGPMTFPGRCMPSGNQVDDLTMLGELGIFYDDAASRKARGMK